MLLLFLASARLWVAWRGRCGWCALRVGCSGVSATEDETCVCVLCVRACGRRSGVARAQRWRRREPDCAASSSTSSIGTKVRAMALTHALNTRISL